MRKQLTRSASADPAVAAVRAEIARRGFKHADAAAVLGISYAAFSRRMSGAVGFSVLELRALAAWLEVSPGVLLGDEAMSA